MNNRYAFLGIGVAIVIIGTCLFLLVESNNTSYNSIIPHIHPLTVTILDSKPHVLHVGDMFTMDAVITNLNYISIPEPSVKATSFNPNTVYTLLTGCSGVGEDRFLEYGDTSIRIPDSCDEIFVANSTGEINVTVNISYLIDGKSHDAIASKVFTILPRIPAENGTMKVDDFNISTDNAIFSVNYTITNGKILGIRSQGNTMDIGTNPTGVGVLNIQLPRTLGDSDIRNLNFTSWIINDKPSSPKPTILTSNGTLSIPLDQGTTTIQITWSAKR